MISKEDNRSKIELEEILESIYKEPIVNIETQPEVVTPVKPDDISLPIHSISGRVSKPPQFYYGFHIEDDKISDSTINLQEEDRNEREVHTYKARLVAKGYTQMHKIDYEETFLPIAKIKSIRIMLAIVAFHNYEIWQMDVKTAFLNGKLIEDVFMAQPEGFENATYPKRVYKLQKAIYGFKQASHSWNLCFHEKVT
nr:putative retrotransposon Ty1-copia subclass protein [Tanacetum cinerariifolium]